MTPLNGSWGAVVKINLQIAYGLFLIWLGWIAYPSDPRWWAFAVLSVCAYFAAVAMIGKAIVAAIKIGRNENLQKELLARGASPHNAKLADDEALRKAGMK